MGVCEESKVSLERHGRIVCDDDTETFVVDLIDDHSRYLLAAVAGPAAFRSVTTGNAPLLFLNPSVATSQPCLFNA